MSAKWANKQDKNVGNEGDIFKHASWVEICRAIAEGGNPIIAIDTHAYQMQAELGAEAKGRGRFPKNGKATKKIKRALRKIVHRIDNKIKDILHKTSRTMVNDCIEKKIGVATIGDSAGTHDGTNFGAVNNQAIVQCPEQKLAAYFSYKFEDIGGKVRYVPEYYTSQTCPQCGCRNTPKNRTYKCKKCGFKYDRDGVGSINIWGIGEKVSLGGAKASLSVVGLLTNPIGWKYHSTHDCLVEPKQQFV